jgi:hypothetical protein
MYIAFLIATVTLLIPTLLPMLRHEAWWVRSFDFPRLQLCCLLLVLLLLELLALDLRDPVAIVLSAVPFACLGYQAWWILPDPPGFGFRKGIWDLSQILQFPRQSRTLACCAQGQYLSRLPAERQGQDHGLGLQHQAAPGGAGLGPAQLG